MELTNHTLIAMGLIAVSLLTYNNRFQIWLFNYMFTPIITTNMSRMAILRLVLIILGFLSFYAVLFYLNWMVALAYLALGSIFEITPMRQRQCQRVMANVWKKINKN